MSLQDKDYVEGVRAGDTQLFEQLVRRYNRMGGAIAFGILGDFQRAEDVVQEAFLKAFRALDSLRDSSRFKPWFAEIVRSKALDAARVRREKTVADVEAVVGCDARYSPGAEDEQIRRESRQLLLDAIRSLPPPDRTVLTLKHMEGLSYKEIAEVTETTVSAVESRLFRARKALKERLGSPQSREK